MDTFDRSPMSEEGEEEVRDLLLKLGEDLYNICTLFVHYLYTKCLLNVHYMYI